MISSLVVGSLLVGQVPILRPFIQADVVVIPEPDPQAVESNLRLFLSSEHETQEFLTAARYLRGYCSWAISHTFLNAPRDPEKLTPLVRRVQNALVQRGMNYSHIRPRTRFLDKIDILMFDQPLEQLSLLRDAFNDPDPAIRSMASEGLRQWIADATHPDRSRWPPKTRKRLMPRIEEHLDEVADLLIWKGLSDVKYWWSESVLWEIDGNQRRIRSLRRALSAGIIRDPDAIRDAESILESWDPIYAAKKHREREAQWEAQRKADLDALGGPNDPFGGHGDDPFGGGGDPFARGKKDKSE